MIVTFVPNTSIIDTVTKGDYDGHPFRGNQWKSGSGNDTPVKGNQKSSTMMLTIGGKYVCVKENPSDDDMSAMARKDDVRVTVDNQFGTVYAWSAFDANHDSVSAKLGIEGENFIIEQNARGGKGTIKEIRTEQRYRQRQAAKGTKWDKKHQEWDYQAE